jgi:hypothetical protein
MFGNNIIATTTYANDKILGQGYDPVGTVDELMIFMPGSKPNSDVSTFGSSD